MDPSLRPLRIAIIGGGVAGLALAGTLAKYGSGTGKLDVAVYEAAACFEGEVGAGITIAARSFEIIHALGLEDDLAEIDQVGKAKSGYTFLYRRSDQGPESHDLILRRFGKGAAYHRAELRAVFARNLARFDSIHVHFNKRLESLSFALRTPNTGPYELCFKDGTTAACDLLIGADGVRSPVRHAMFDIAASTDAQGDSTHLRAYGPPIWSGECVYRSLVPMARLASEWERMGGEGPHRIMNDRLQYCGKGKKIVAYTIQKKTLVNVGTFVTTADAEGTPFESQNWVQDVDPSFIPGEFEGWETEARAVVNSITKASRWAIHVVKKLPFFAYDRIAVIGDAAHAMTPHNGSGANQALEGAFLLGRLLTHPSTTAQTVSLVLQAYDAICRPRAQEVAALSAEIGRLGNFTADLQLTEGDDEDAIIAERMRACGERVLQGCMEDDVQRAITMFQSLVEGRAYVSV